MTTLMKMMMMMKMTMNTWYPVDVNPPKSYPPYYHVYGMWRRRRRVMVVVVVGPVVISEIIHPW